MGWIEIDSKKSTNAYKWAKNGYDYAKKLAKNEGCENLSSFNTIQIGSPQGVKIK